MQYHFQDDEKSDDIPTNTVASETTKLSEEQKFKDKVIRKNIIEKGGVDQISKIKDQTNNPSTTNEKTVGSLITIFLLIQNLLSSK